MVWELPACRFRLGLIDIPCRLLAGPQPRQAGEGAESVRLPHDKGGGKRLQKTGEEAQQVPEVSSRCQQQ